MRFRPVFIDDVEATAIEGSPLGSICIAPVVLGDSTPTDEERSLVKKKARLLRRLLADDELVTEIEDLYGDAIHLPPILVCFTKNPPRELGDDWLGVSFKTPLEIEGSRFHLVELNLHDADDRVKDAERLLALWAGFLGMALCHSTRRPAVSEQVSYWSHVEAKRGWLHALKRGKLMKPRRKYVMGLERPYCGQGTDLLNAVEQSSLLLSFPLHFKSEAEYLQKMKRKIEHLPQNPSIDDRFDFVQLPPWRWNCTSGFVDVLHTSDGDLLAQVHIATSSRKVYRYGSVEPTSALASSGKIYRYFSCVQWSGALRTDDVRSRLQAFLDLVATYAKWVFGWNAEVRGLGQIASIPKI